MWLSYHRAAIKLSCFCKKITRDYSFGTLEDEQKRMIDSQIPNSCAKAFDGHAVCGNYSGLLSFSHDQYKLLYIISSNLTSKSMRNQCQGQKNPARVVVLC